MDTQGGGPVFCDDLPVLQLHQEGLAQGIAQPQSENGTDGGERGSGQSQGDTGQYPAAVEQHRRSHGACPAGESGGPDSRHAQYCGGNIEDANGPIGQAGAGILKLI